MSEPRQGWLLFDYGEVISLPQPAEELLAMSVLAQLDPVVFTERYWRHRLSYDRGQAAHLYWADVLGRRLVAGDPVVADLALLDTGSWSHLNPEMARLLGELVDDGHRLALLSNAPVPIADMIDEARWARSFRHRFFSCRLALTKPDPAIYEAVLRQLGAAPDEVTFIDDRPENRQAAAALGIRPVAYPGPSVQPVADLRTALSGRP